MSLLYLLDTNIVSYIAEDQPSAAKAHLLSLQSEELACVSAVTEAEARCGLARRPAALHLHLVMNAFLERVQVLPWGRPEAKAYGLLRARLEAAGLSLAPIDRMIAAHALATGAILVTGDRAFRQVEDLHTVNWATDILN